MPTPQEVRNAIWQQLQERNLVPEQKKQADEFWEKVKATPIHDLPSGGYGMVLDGVGDAGFEHTASKDEAQGAMVGVRIAVRGTRAELGLPIQLTLVPNKGDAAIIQQNCEALGFELTRNQDGRHIYSKVGGTPEDIAKVEQALAADQRLPHAYVIVADEE